MTTEMRWITKDESYTWRTADAREQKAADAFTRQHRHYAQIPVNLADELQKAELQLAKVLQKIDKYLKPQAYAN